MKSAVLALIVVVTVVVPSMSETCWQNPEDCPSKGKCCQQFGASELVQFGSCRAFQAEGERCEVKPLKSTKAKHVYLMMCPCGEGLECKSNSDSIYGKCQPSGK